MRRARVKAPALDVPAALNVVIKRRISELELKREQVANALWIARTDLYNRLTGKVYWSFPELVSISEILDIRVDRLITLAVLEAKQNGKVHLAQGGGQR